MSKIKVAYFDKTILKPAMIYGSKCLVMNRKIEQSMNVVEMNIIR